MSIVYCRADQSIEDAIHLMEDSNPSPAGDQRQEAASGYAVAGRRSSSCQPGAFRRVGARKLTVEDVVRRVKGVKGIAQEIEVRPAISSRTADDEITTCPSSWGNGTTSSSDGQFFQASDRSANHGDVNLHHGSEPGSKFHSHLSPISTATQHYAHRSDRKRGCLCARWVIWPGHDPRHPEALYRYRRRE